MSQSDDVYTIVDEDLLDSLRQGVERRRGAGVRPTREKRPAPDQVARRRDRRPRPLVASTLSLLVCGAGQVYNGEAKLGALMFLTEMFALAAHWSLARTWTVLREFLGLFGIGELQMMLAVAGADLLFVLLLLGGIHHAYRRAEKASGRFEGLGRPVLSGLASMLLPGWGQLLNAQVGKAVIFLFSLLAAGLAAAFWIASPLPRLLAALMASVPLLQQGRAALLAAVGAAGFLWILSVYDAVLVATFRRRTASW